MSESAGPPEQPADPYGTPPASPGMPPPPPNVPPGGYGYAVAQPGPIGETRGTGKCILLAIVTLGFYTWYWYYKVHSEMKAHRDTGLGGGLALLLTIVVGIVMPYITASEVGNMYEARGQQKPVSGMTGLWYFPGSFIIVGPIVWFVKTNGALNDYWRSLGAA